MTTKTKTELRNRILQHIRVLATGQTASAEDATRADAVIQAEIERLEDENVITFDSSVGITASNIPARMFEGLTMAISPAMRSSYGQDVERMADGTPIEEFRGMKMLRRSVLAGTDDVPTSAEYF